MTELWKKMTREEHKPKYKNSWYEISNQGRVRRWMFTKKKYRYLKGVKHNGYLRIEINKKLHFIHRLVLIYFVGDHPEDQPYCDHKNMIRDDNRLQNLHWVSPYQNSMNKKNNRKDIKELDPKKRKNLLSKLLRQKKRINCVCGGISSTQSYNKKQHESSKKHQNYITNIGKI